MVKISFLVPIAWRDELIEAAAAQAISMAALCRLVLRGFLRGRHDPEQRAALDGGAR